MEHKSIEKTIHQLSIIHNNYKPQDSKNQFPFSQPFFFLALQPYPTPGEIKLLIWPISSMSLWDTPGVLDTARFVEA